MSAFFNPGARFRRMNRGLDFARERLKSQQATNDATHVFKTENAKNATNRISPPCIRLLMVLGRLWAE
jgi:hypothetical protein